MAGHLPCALLKVSVTYFTGMIRNGQMLEGTRTLQLLMVF